MKKNIIILILSIFLLIVLFAFINSLEYKISEIDADNFGSKLKVEKILNSVDEIGVEISYLSGRNLLMNPKEYYNCVPVAGEYSNIEKYDNTIYQRYSLNHLSYLTIFDRITEKPIYLNLTAGDGSDRLTVFYDIRLKKFMDKLISNHGFAIKCSKLKEGHDILIKETEDSFIIVQVYVWPDLADNKENAPRTLIVNSYSKKKCGIL